MPQGKWVMEDAGVFMDSHFVHMITLVLVESTGLLELLTSILFLVLRSRSRSSKCATLGKSLAPAKCWFIVCVALCCLFIDESPS